jgi:hypothetical protein
MTAKAATSKAAERAASDLKGAIDQARLAYAFAPRSYTYGALQACLAADHALGVLRAMIDISPSATEPD